MGYCETTDVAALVSQIVSGSADFGTNTNPTKAQVQAFVSSGCALLDTLTQGNGYTPPASSNAIYGIYKQANALYAAALAERRRTVDQTAPGVKSRSDLLWADFKFHIGLLFGTEAATALDLASAGLATNSTAGPYAGGISIDDIESQEDDTDRVPARFVRGMSSRFTDTLGPSKISSKS